MSTRTGKPLQSKPSAFQQWFADEVEKERNNAALGRVIEMRGLFSVTEQLHNRVMELELEVEKLKEQNRKQSERMDAQDQRMDAIKKWAEGLKK